MLLFHSSLNNNKGMYPHRFHNTRSLPEVIAGKLPLPERKQLIEIILLKPELLHDIEDQLSDVQNTFRPDGKALLPADGSYMLNRHIDTAVNQAVSRCQAYLLLPSPFVQRISTNHAHEWEEKSIFLALPHNWPPHTVGSLRDAIHNYIVMRACQLFLSLKEPKASEACDTLAESFYDDINRHLSARLGPINIKPSFLG